MSRLMKIHQKYEPSLFLKRRHLQCTETEEASRLNHGGENSRKFTPNTIWFISVKVIIYSSYLLWKLGHIKLAPGQVLYR